MWGALRLDHRRPAGTDHKGQEGRATRRGGGGQFLPDPPDPPNLRTSTSGVCGRGRPCEAGSDVRVGRVGRPGRASGARASAQRARCGGGARRSAPRSPGVGRGHGAVKVALQQLETAGPTWGGVLLLRLPCVRRTGCATMRSAQSAVLMAVARDTWGDSGSGVALGDIWAGVSRGGSRRRSRACWAGVSAARGPERRALDRAARWC